MRRMRVRVPTATVWVEPKSPRAVDAAAVADPPDIAGWLAAMDAHAYADGDGRGGVRGRVHTQLVLGEPVLALGDGDNTAAGFTQVVCPWQPSSRDERGYPGWVPARHLEADDGPNSIPQAQPLLEVPAGERPDLTAARRYLGLPYLWGGLSPLGLDCSGLVHLVHRTLGTVLPRDAHDQQAAGQPVGPDAAQPGDLYFFAASAGPADHVGIVTGAYRMIHASGELGVVEEPLDERRLGTLIGAGRIPASGSR